MSIAQKGTTWLPRFFRKNESLLPQGRLETTPLDDRLSPSPNDSAVGAPIDSAPLASTSQSDVTAAATTVSVVTAPTQPAMTTPAVNTAAPLGPAVIHPMACVDPRAKIADGVEIGPFCVVGPDVSIGRGTKLLNNVTITGHTKIGANNLIFPNAVLGAIPQDKKFFGEVTYLEIGDNNHIRENVTIHLGTGKGGSLTKVGSNNLLMVGVHLGHDVFIGDNCVIANNVLLAGHVHVGNNVVLSGMVGIHHFVTVGDYVYTAGMVKITHDVPPFVKLDEHDRIRAVNSLGLRRAGFRDDDIAAIEAAVWKLFLARDREPMNIVLRKFRDGKFPELSSNPHVMRVVEFIERRNLGKHGRYLESLRAG